MTADRYIQSVIDHVPPGLPVRDHVAMDLRSHIDERLSHGDTLDDVLRQLGDPLTLAESYLAALPLESAHVGRRLLAKLVDVLAVVVLIVGVTELVRYVGSSYLRGYDGAILIACVFAIVLLFPVYSAVAEYRYGYTLGKRLMHLLVVRESGARISLGRAIVRQLPFFAQFFWVDALFALFADRRQRAFELLSKTRTVATPEPAS